MKTNLLVNNLQCTHCVSTINKELRKINGVYGIEADIANQRLVIDHTEDVSLQQVSSTLTELGYPNSISKLDTFYFKAASWDSNPRRIAQAEKFFKKITEIIPLKPTDTVMDFGCGTGLVGLQFTPYVSKLIMADNSAAMLSVLKEKIAALPIEASKFEILSAPIKEFANSEIDVVVSLMTFHHIEEPELVINELYQKIKAGGYLAIGDLAKEDGSFHEEKVAHNGFDTEILINYLQAAGFKIIFNEIFNQFKKETTTGIKEYKQFLIIAKK
ncbi:MAG: methyltransferase domain-containing protein [Paludibacteraceae bacterium]|nr:methyltransferase domain-containing protein [Paludibacteraceae bacterium]MBN2786818.1 methyltransferase domain-containing protein [Paludibacteraceae bacterium]